MAFWFCRFTDTDVRSRLRAKNPIRRLKRTSDFGDEDRLVSQTSLARPGVCAFQPNDWSDDLHYCGCRRGAAALGDSFSPLSLDVCSRIYKKPIRIIGVTESSDDGRRACCNVNHFIRRDRTCMGIDPCESWILLRRSLGMSQAVS